jgi:hypothetical protein
MVFTMAYPNFKKGLKMAFGPLGVKTHKYVCSPICIIYFGAQCCKSIFSILPIVNVEASKVHYIIIVKM